MGRKDVCHAGHGEVSLDMYHMDPDWSTPSMVDQNPLIWGLEVNGLIIDVRHAPREIQEAAFRQGLSDHAENTGPSPLGLAPHSLTSSCVLLFARPKESRLRCGGLSSGSGEAQNIHLLLDPPLVAGPAFLHDGQCAATAH